MRYRSNVGFIICNWAYNYLITLINCFNIFDKFKENKMTTITREMLNNLNIDFINDIPHWTLLGKQATALINVSDMEQVRKMIKYMSDNNSINKLTLEEVPF